MSRYHEDGNGALRHVRAWRPSLPKHPSQRRAMSISLDQAASLPASCFDKQFTHVPTYDQKSLGSCTDNAALYNLRHVLVKHDLDSGLSVDEVLKNLFEPSRLYLYAKARQRQGTPLTEDSGSDTETTHEALEFVGVCDEKFMPYSDDPEVWSRPPSAEAEADAANHRELLGYEPDSIEAQKHSIVQGFGVQFGFTCYKGLMSRRAAETGEIPMPAPSERSIGAHEMYRVGFDDNCVVGESKGVWIVAQSWGEWGATFDGVRRYGLMPYDYDRAGLASDFRTIRLVRA